MTWPIRSAQGPLSATPLRGGLLGREVNLFTEKREVGKPGDFDHMADEELTQFIEAQGEVVRELERQLLHPPIPKRRKGATKHSDVPSQAHRTQ